jgi:streptogramin lyase
VAIGDGSLWVGAHRSNYLWRIDPTTDKIVARINLGQAVCGPIAIIGTLVWTNYCDGSTQNLAVDSTTNQVVQSVKVQAMFAEGGGSVWGSDFSSTQLTRYDPTTYKPTGTVQVAGTTAVASGQYLWVADTDANISYHNHLTEVDMTTGAIVKRITTLAIGNGGSMDLVNGIMWMKGAYDDNLLRVDTATGVSTKVVIPHFSTQTDFGDDSITDGMGSIWLKSSDTTISRLDATTGALQATYPTDGSGGYVVVGFGSVWSTNFDDDTVWRDRVTGGQ